MDILGLISTYIRVVEAGSIAGAARAQGLSAAAVSQSLARLESHLGVRLLSRTTRRLAMTESGARYFEKVRHIPRDVETAAHLATLASEPQGPLRVATTAAFGRHLLAPLLPAFKRRYPGIDIELIGSDRRLDHRLEQIDVSLRIKAQLSDSLVARRIASRAFLFCAAPAYLAHAGTPSSPEDLQHHACLLFRYPTDGRYLPWRFIRDGNAFEAATKPGFVCDDIDMLAQIAVNGGGIARLADFVALPLIERGQLVPLFGTDSQGAAPAQSEPMDIYACVAERSALSGKVRAFIDFLEQALPPKPG
ncbi:LysR family transcriptional regulator [Pseudomonas oryzihabitans]|uniref:LysR family transcriptional regulator n=1 Tax=Pseudomonas oryzihabitans TaxID=47885 RepID=UPI0007374E3A|nr:LysR family transcriptional regulator [Pseudomonas psychrotolerans]KTT51257.1 LysR family transcriptional regulator [Pseudomonas psychrotolerans]